MRPVFLVLIVFSLIGFWPLIFTVKAASQAALFLNPASGSFLVGSTFDLSIILDTKNSSVNTVEVELLFPADKIQVASQSLGGQSIIQLWPAPPSFSNKEGRIYFIGGIPSPGINTSQGIVLTLTFRVIAPGSGQISFGKSSTVLANDGKATNILGQKPPAFLKFMVPPPQGPEISSPTHSDQEKWHRDNNPVFAWPKSQFATAFSYDIDNDPAGFPDAVAEGPEATASFQNLENGIWYFHLRERSDNIWGGVSHFVVKVDNQPPAAFDINVSPGKRTTNKNPIFRFFTTDSLSGFDYFQMKIIPLFEELENQGLFFEVSSPYQAPAFKPGRYQVVIRALDKAGNSKDEAVTMNILGSFSQFIDQEGINFFFFFIPWAAALYFAGFLMLVFLAVLFILWRRHSHHLQHAFKEDIRNLFNLFKRNKIN
ncbi:MAG: cohesin domain-containing protein [Patescibacteria group bacterium]